MTAHSPTPWRSGGEANDCILSWVDGPVLIFYPGYEQEDMEFILRAVNCHDELVAALRAISENPSARIQVAHIARAALAKAEAK